MLTVTDVKNDAEVKVIMQIAESQIEALGFTEHSVRHSSIVSRWAGEILQKNRRRYTSDRACQDRRIFA